MEASTDCFSICSHEAWFWDLQDLVARLRTAVADGRMGVGAAKQVEALHIQLSRVVAEEMVLQDPAPEALSPGWAKANEMLGIAPASSSPLTLSERARELGERAAKHSDNARSSRVLGTDIRKLQQENEILRKNLAGRVPAGEPCIEIPDRFGARAAPSGRCGRDRHRIPKLFYVHLNACVFSFHVHKGLLAMKVGKRRSLGTCLVLFDVWG